MGDYHNSIFYYIQIKQKDPNFFSHSKFSLYGKGKGAGTGGSGYAPLTPPSEVVSVYNTSTSSCRLKAPLMTFEEQESLLIIINKCDILPPIYKLIVFSD